MSLNAYLRDIRKLPGNLRKFPGRRRDRFASQERMIVSPAATSGGRGETHQCILGSGPLRGFDSS